MSKKNGKGNGLIVALLIILILCVIGLSVVLLMNAGIIGNFGDPAGKLPTDDTTSVPEITNTLLTPDSDTLPSADTPNNENTEAITAEPSAETTAEQYTETTAKPTPETTAKPTPETTAQPTHTHLWSSWKTLKAATCTEAGNQERSCACGEKENQTVKAKGHSAGNWITDKAATCTTGGSRHQVCITCGVTVKTESVSATGHKAGEWVIDKDATCTTDGSRHQTCSVCGTTTKTETIKASGHKEGSWITDKAATCTLAGSRYKKCSTCGTTLKTETLKATGHTEVIDKAVAATCTKSGLTEGKHCKNCNTVLTAQNTIPATGHKEGSWVVAKEATSTENGTKNLPCTLCGAVLKTEVIYSKGSEGLLYRLNDDGEGYTVVGMGECKDTNLVIPREYKGLPVTSIGASAFEYSGYYPTYGSIKSVVLPDTVVSIQTEAFYKQGITDIVWGGVVEIGASAFYQCGRLTNLKLTNNIKTIGESAFKNCSGLKEVTLSDGVVTICESAFEGCSKLQTLTFGRNVETVGQNAFYNCTDLSEVRTPDIESWCKIDFEKDSVHRYGNHPNFASNPLYYAHHLYLTNGERISNLVIPETVTKIGQSAFYYATGLKSITIKGNISEICAYAFSYCSGLKNVIIPETVNTIGNYAFYECSAIESVTIKGNIENAGSGIFSSCSNLERIILSESFQHVGEDMFYGCDALDGVYITDLASWCSLTFDGYSTLGLLSWAKNLYLNNELVTDLYIPEGITQINTSVFAGGSFESVTIPSSVKVIEDSAFNSCDNLIEIYIPGTVESIMRHAFSGCTNLRTIRIGLGIQNLDSFIFSSCPNVTGCYFEGTKSEWRNINKAYDWKGSTTWISENYYSSGPTFNTVHCVDGDTSS